MRKWIAGSVMFLLVGMVAFPAKLSLKLSSGLHWISGKDYNTGIKGLNDYLKATYPPVSGIFQNLDKGLKFQGEAILQITPKIGIGIGGGYFRIARNDTVTYYAIGYADAIRYSPQLSVIPLFVNFHYNVKAGANLDIDVYGGPALYLSSLKWTDSDVWVLWDLSHTFSSSATAFGFQAGAGVEFRLAPSLAILLDASYHFGKINEIAGPWATKGSIFFTTADAMYPESFMWYYLNGSYPMVSLGPTAPSGASGERKAVLDLSGFALGAGIRIAL